jgi:hypothetical protein
MIDQRGIQALGSKPGRLLAHLASIVGATTSGQKDCPPGWGRNVCCWQILLQKFVEAYDER